MTSSSGSKPEDRITPQPLMLPRESRLTRGGIKRFILVEKVRGVARTSDACQRNTCFQNLTFDRSSGVRGQKNFCPVSPSIRRVSLGY